MYSVCTYFSFVQFLNVLIFFFVDCFICLCVDANTTETKVVQSGNSITFSCPFGVDIYDVSFKKADAGNRIFTYIDSFDFTPTNGRVHFDIETLIVTLTDVSVEDEELYTCTVTNNAADTLITTTRVHVYSKLFSMFLFFTQEILKTLS